MLSLGTIKILCHTLCLVRESNCGPKNPNGETCNTYVFPCTWQILHCRTKYRTFVASENSKTCTHSLLKVVLSDRTCQYI